MKINEIEVGSNVEIIVSINGNPLIFESVVSEVLEGSILVEPIMENDKTVGFSDYESQVIAKSADNKLYIWKGVKVKLVKFNGKIYHQLKADEESIPYNRRRHYRQFVGEEGFATYLARTCPVVVRDVSAKGCSFVSDFDFEIGSEITVKFADDKENYVIHCTVVRREVVEESGKTIYGCEMKFMNSKIERYITNKQRQEMQRRAGNYNPTNRNK